MRAPRLLSLVLAVAACGGPGRAAAPTTPAATGVRAYLAALEANDPRAAYGLLDADTRREVGYDAFALAWRQSELERAWQARVLREALKGNPEAGERAAVTYGDGKVVHLEREGKTWRLESELVSRSRASHPRDAIRRFADAIAARDLTAVLGTLTQRRRDGLSRELEGFVAGIGKRVNDRIDEFGADRAELRWDQDGIRYRIVLRKESDEWRIDDIHIRPAPQQDRVETDTPELDDLD